MFLHFSIKNYALIQCLEIDFSKHFNVVTGETGTGKSIIISALGLLLGKRANATVAYHGKCIVEGTFKIENYALNDVFEKENIDYYNETTMRREISLGGKNRAFINDTPVTLEVMKKIGLQVMNIHSQHETMGLISNLFQLHIIDTYAENKTYKNDYKLAWKNFMTATKKYNDILEESKTIKHDSDFLSYQLKELEEAKLEEKNQEYLEKQLEVNEHAEEIKTQLNTILNQLHNNKYSTNGIMTEAQSTLRSLTSYSDQYTTLYNRLESLGLELKDIIAEVQKEEEKINCDTEKTKEIKERLDSINTLLYKHKCTSITQLVLLQKNFRHKKEKNKGLEDSLIASKQTLKRATDVLHSISKKLSQSRSDILQTFCTHIVNLLQKLGMPHAKLYIEHKTGIANPTGIDTVKFLFSANKGVAERPLDCVASGGELSRLMFCIQYILAEKCALPTLILDEIDTGISGEIAIRLSHLMKKIAIQCQLLVITHLPQIAAKASTHFCVYKKYDNNKTTSMVKSLNEEERIIEIAKMISGDKPSASATKNARELIHQ